MNKIFLKLLTSLSIAAVLAGCSLIDTNSQEETASSSANSSQSSSADSAASSSAAASSVQSSIESSESAATESESVAASAAAESESESIAASAAAESESESIAASAAAESESESIAASAAAESESIAAAEAAESESIAAAAAVAPAINPGYGDWYIEDGTWHQASNPGYQRWVGESAIVVNISAQTMWAISDGQILIETPITTGKPGEETPTGFYNIQHKESPSVLVGEDYAAPVTFWMPFIGNSYGFHDASWQPSFGGGQYVNGYGSLGCINLPYWAAETLYLNFYPGEEVIII